jgi:hypothetical protein
VREISRAIAQRGVNVEELESHTSSAPMSGETLFHAAAWLRLPATGDPDELRNTLEKLADELMVELHARSRDELTRLHLADLADAEMITARARPGGSSRSSRTRA